MPCAPRVAAALCGARLYGIFNGMKTTIDSGGRIVIPKKIREQARVGPGTEIELAVVGDVIELRPVSRKVRLCEEGSLLVAMPEEPVPLLSAEAVERTTGEVRERQRWMDRRVRGSRRRRGR